LTPGPSAANHGGSLTAAIPEQQKVVITASGRSGGRAVRVSTPKVLPPCFYSRRGSGKEMAEQIADPGTDLSGQLTDALGALLTMLTYPEAQKAKDETHKFWWEPSCKWVDSLVDPTDSAGEQALTRYKFDWALQHGAWLLVPDTDPPPVVQVPAEILAVLAAAEARRQVRMPRLRFDPSEGKPTFVGLATAVWAVPGDWTRVAATASQGDLIANIWADPVSMSFDGLPPGSQTGSCAEGGTPYRGATEPACFIRFSEQSGRQRDHVWPVTITVTWQVGADVPFVGERQIRTRRTVGFRVEEVQTVGTRLRSAA
jgi:hypothetical protein